LSDINGTWIQKAMGKTPHKRIILDMTLIQVFRLQSGEALVICSGIQNGKFPATPGSSEKNQAPVSSQPPREIYQNRSEGCQTQQIYHVSNGRSYYRQEAVCRDIVSD